MKQRRWIGWTVLGGLAVAALALLAVPMMLIQPFAAQSPASIAVAFALRRWAPMLTILMGAGALVVAAKLWGKARPLARAGAIVALLLQAGAIWLSRQNLFERMFAPLADSRFVRPAEAAWVEQGDMVLAVTLGGDAVAYPVRQVSYHHVVQDSVGRVPIVATY